MSNRVKARLVLEDGSVFEGYSFGAGCCSAGEVVFNTGMTGYVETLTDPSYYGQILVQTYPLIGNYGVPDGFDSEKAFDFFESDGIKVKGLIVSQYSENFSHYQAKLSLSEWLKKENVPAITGIDTRRLTILLREKGVMKGKILIEDKDIPFYNPSEENLVEKVSVKKPKIYGKGEIKIALIDCGVKNNIIRCLLKRGVQVIKVPWDSDLKGLDYDGILVSNGPGDPSKCEKTIENVSSFLKGDKPVFGICLGNQIMALASWGKTYKLKYGHRGFNQPVLLNGTEKCFITSQNHGYAVDSSSLSEEWEIYFKNLNDNTNEGIIHKNGRHFAVQFHPEANGGPFDTEFLFDVFLSKVKENLK